MYKYKTQMALYDTTSLSPATIRNYSNTLTIANEGNYPKSLKFLDDIETVTKRLYTKANGTYKARLTAIIAILNRSSGNRTPLYLQYKKLFDEVKSKIEDHLISGEKTETEIENWIKPKELEDIYKNLYDKAHGKDATFTDIQNLFLLSFYTDLPTQRRLELLNTWVYAGNVSAEDEQKFETDKEKNYLLLQKHKLIFNIHKNTKTKGTKILNYAKYGKFIQTLNFYIAHLANKGDTFPILQIANGKQIKTGEMIRNRLNSIFQKNVSVQMLRKIQDTEETHMTKQDLENLIGHAEAQGHSLITHIRNYMKNK
jgi:hypothetical protein